jgi:hypothetical protein
MSPRAVLLIIAMCLAVSSCVLLKAPAEPEHEDPCGGLPYLYGTDC